MILEASAAKAIAALIIASTQGGDYLKPQLPLQTIDRGDTWVVTGTPYADSRRQTANIMAWMIIRKDTAEIIGLEFTARIIPSDAERAVWPSLMSPADYARVFGPATRFEPNGIRDIYLAAWGGIINTPADAVAYGEVLIGAGAAPVVPNSELRAIERNEVWYLRRHRVGEPDTDVLAFSRVTGKLLSASP